MEFVETSAKNGKNVQQAFVNVVTKVLNDIERGQIDPRESNNGIQVSGASSDNIMLSKNIKEKFNCCSDS